MANIGPLEETIKEAQRELARVRHVESYQQAKLWEENELLRQQLQLQGQREEDRPHLLGEQQQQEEATIAKDTTEEPQKKERMQAGLEALNRKLQERELQEGLEI